MVRVQAGFQPIVLATVVSVIPAVVLSTAVVRAEVLIHVLLEQELAIPTIHDLTEVHAQAAHTPVQAALAVLSREQPADIRAVGRAV